MEKFGKLSFIVIPPLTSFDSDLGFRNVISLLKECGYDGIEFNITEPLGFAVSDLVNWTRDAGLNVPALLTGEAYEKGFCLSSPDESIRRKTKDLLLRYIEKAGEFESLLVLGLLQGLRCDEDDPGVANDRIVDCISEISEEAESSGVEIVFEPVNHLQVGFNNSVSEVLSLIKRIDSPAVKPMVDTIHLNIEERSLIEPIKDCGSDLRHVHLCESNASLYGTGRIDFGAVLKTLSLIGYKRFVSVKVYRNATLEEAARSSIQYIRNLNV